MKQYIINTASVIAFSNAVVIHMPTEPYPIISNGKATTGLKTVLNNSVIFKNVNFSYATM